MRERPPILARRRVLLTDFRDVGLEHDLALVGHYHNVAAEHMLVAHRHPELMEICYLARGRQVYHVAGKDYFLRAGDVFVTRPGEQHSTGGQPQERGELFWIQVRLPRRGPWLHLSSADVRVVTRQLRQLPSRHFAAGRMVRDLFQHILICAAGPAGELKRIRLCTYLLQLFVELHGCAGASVGRSDPEDLNTLLSFIAEHRSEPLSVGQMARQMNLSESWFKARFRRAMGVPPAEYLQRIRIERASEMLQQGVSVTQTAMTMGFSSSQYFATVFKRFTGRRPSDVAVSRG